MEQPAVRIIDVVLNLLQPQAKRSAYDLSNPAF
jgi:hypothetical protein